MLTAREKFQQSGHAATHKKWAESLDAEAACDYALLALVEEQPAQSSAMDALHHAELVGARRYRDLLLTLHTVKPPTKGGGILGPPLRSPG